MSGLKSFVGRKSLKKVPFMGEHVEVKRLSVAEVFELQEMIKNIDEGDEKAYFKVMQHVIRQAVEGGDEMTDEDFGSLPMEDLSNLAESAMTVSQVQAGK
jgi:hypothetical protein